MTMAGADLIQRLMAAMGLLNGHRELRPFAQAFEALVPDWLECRAVGLYRLPSGGEDLVRLGSQGRWPERLARPLRRQDALWQCWGPGVLHATAPFLHGRYLLRPSGDAFALLLVEGLNVPLPDDDTPFGLILNHAVALLDALCGQDDMNDLLDAFVKVLARAVDEKSPHTSGHCERVPLITELLADAVSADEERFARVVLSDSDRHELMMAAWLHDCGKLTTPDSLLDKATKLHRFSDGIELVSVRLAVLWNQWQLDTERALARTPEQAPALRQALDRRRQDLNEALALLRRVNLGGEQMAAADQERVRALAAWTWEDLEGRPQPLLTPDEVEVLCVPRGTLSPAERDIVNHHIVVTLNMLESLPFPPHLRRVPEYAGGHHERLDGSGFPRGLREEQLALPTRILAIADVFEALTAHDRPYKPPMRISEALTILRRMRDARHIDPDLYDLFIRARVWETYARQALREEQLDVVDASAYL